MCAEKTVINFGKHRAAPRRLRVVCLSLRKLRVSAPLWWGFLFGAIALGRCQRAAMTDASLDYSGEFVRACCVRRSGNSLVSGFVIALRGSKYATLEMTCRGSQYPCASRGMGPQDRSPKQSLRRFEGMPSNSPFPVVAVKTLSFLPWPIFSTLVCFFCRPDRAIASCRHTT